MHVKEVLEHLCRIEDTKGKEQIDLSSSVQEYLQHRSLIWLTPVDSKQAKPDSENPSVPFLTESCSRTKDGYFIMPTQLGYDVISGLSNLGNPLISWDFDCFLKRWHYLSRIDLQLANDAASHLQDIKPPDLLDVYIRLYDGMHAFLNKKVLQSPPKIEKQGMKEALILAYQLYPDFTLEFLLAVPSKKIEDRIAVACCNVKIMELQYSPKQLKELGELQLYYFCATAQYPKRNIFAPRILYLRING